MKTKKRTRFLSIVLSLIMILSVMPLGAFNLTASAASAKVEAAISWAIAIANDNVHGYSQANRLGPDYDCSSFVSTAFNVAGFNVRCDSNTGNMRARFTAAGFTWIPKSQLGGLTNSSYLKRGDILLRDTGAWGNQHTELYIGNNQNVAAHANYDSQPGGNKGGCSWSAGWQKYRYGADEICVDPYWNDSWDGVLRYTKDDADPVPATPSITNISSTNIAVNDSITINWNAVSYATSYTVAVRANNDKIYQDINVGGATSYTYKLSENYAYDFYVKANGKSGSSSWSSKRTCTAHNPVTVTFKDWDDKDIQKTTVKYGGSAMLPVLDPRQGYDFQGWEGTYTNVTSDSIVKAKYKIITYTVNFLDKNDNILKTEKVDFGNDATPPTKTNAPIGYKFYGWSSESYKNVYTDALNKTINVSAIYNWTNDDLPIVCSITSAVRRPDGYYVKFDLTNYDKAVTRGRAVVVLKTAEGKLVDSAESTAFSIPVDSTKRDIEVYIPCDSCATKAEVMIVNSYSSGVPISEKKTSIIENATNISEWSNVRPEADENDIETRTVYSSRDKLTATGNTKTLQGYEWDGTYVIKTTSGETTSAISSFENESQKRVVTTQSVITGYNTKTQYRYMHYTNGSRSYPYSVNGCSLHYSDWSDTQKIHKSDVEGYWKYGDVNTWGYCGGCGRDYFPWYNQETRTVNSSPIYQTKYYYTDTFYTYNFFKWSAWSDWSTDPIDEIDGKRQVKSETQYRSINSSTITEKSSGTERTINGKLSPDFAGKQITLYVYGWIGASDFTNQYIGQSVVGSDGSYSFTFKLLNEPTIKSGDYTVSIGIEGTTDLIEIGKIEAPVREYTVNFYNWDGKIINTQIVEEGGYAIPPENPEKEGYDFLGWDDSIINITDNADIRPVMKKKEFTVIYIDWMNQIIEVDTVEYGKVLTPPEIEEVKGYNFIGWDAVEEGNSIVTENMVVSAQYEKKAFSIRFYGLDGEVIRTENVEYGDSALPPEIETTSDGKIFAGWSNPENYNSVDGDAYIVPIYFYAETVSTPVANYDSGEYDSNIQLTLTTDNSEDVIYYYFNGNETEEYEYTGPITIDRTCSITYHASCLGKNDSYGDTKYYCINTAGTPSDWMLYEKLPEDVKNSPADYTLETDTGYSYKDVISTSNISEIANLESSGWTLENTVTSEYSDWQTEKINQDSETLNFQIDTRSEENNAGTSYQYSRFKYTDESGEVCYSPTEVDGFECELEKTDMMENKQNIAGFDNGISYFMINGQKWYNQKKFLVEYRSRYDVSTYYKWTDYSVEAAPSGDIRESKTADMYRYMNKNYHIVTIWPSIDEYCSNYFVEDGKIFDLSNINNVTGYKFVRLYSDADKTNIFSNSTPITSSVELFAAYSPLKYAVTFQMGDGTEIDYQLVDYLESATSPEMYEVPGYVFAGWDKDFSCITEETVITGKYVPVSEYAYIALNMSNAMMYQGSYIELKATITPLNLTKEEIVWSTSNSNVAVVDDTGLVKAVGKGEAVITAKVVSSKETATCKVVVDEDMLNNILLTASSKLGFDDAGYIRGIKAETTVGNLRKEFKNSDLVFADINNNLLSDEDFVGTGTYVMIKNGEVVTDMAICIVTGDMNGDGYINNRDVALFCQYLVDKVTASDCQIIAMDANGDGKVNNRDAAMLAQYLVGKATL